VGAEIAIVLNCFRLMTQPEVIRLVFPQRIVPENYPQQALLPRALDSAREMVPAQPVDATPSNQLIRQYFL
jgi:hypothetical protein